MTAAIQTVSEETTAEPAAEPINNRLRLVVIALVLVLIGAGGGVVWWRHSASGHDKVPLARPRASYVLEPMEAGKARFALGLLKIDNPGTDLQIIDVKARTSPNVAYLGAYALWPNDPYLYTVGPFYPVPQQVSKQHPINELIPAEEFTKGAARFKETSFVSVTVGFEVTSGDVGAMNGVLVTYRAGGKVQRQFFSQAAIACIKPNPCGLKPYDASYGQSVFRRFGLIPS
jgi:hypothetical protein